MDKRLRLTPKQKKVVNHFKDVLKQLLDEDIRIIQEYTIDDAIYGRFDRLSFINFKNVIDCEVWDDDGEEYYDDEREDMEWYAPPINELEGISASSDFNSYYGVCISDNEEENFALVLKNLNYKPHGEK